MVSNTHFHLFEGILVICLANKDSYWTVGVKAASATIHSQDDKNAEDGVPSQERDPPR